MQDLLLSDTEESNEGRSIRLQVFISHSGICSRRAAASIIEQGRVKVNRQTIFVPGHRVDLYKDVVIVDGKRCTIQEQFVYFLMNKPKKVESTNYTQTYDDRTREPRRTVTDIIRRFYNGHIYSVGRLDYHSSGLLLFTNDGQLCNRLTHPKYGVEKTYLLETKNELPEKIFLYWQSGICIHGIKYTLSRYTLKSDKEVVLVLQEGKNREIRNVCEHYHIIIKKLHRISVGPISLNNLAGGKVRPLTEKEIKHLYQEVNLLS